MKKLIIALCSICGVGIIGVGIYGFMGVKADKVEVGVYPVTSITTIPYDEGESLYGNISTDVNQEVRLSQDQIVEEVYVSEGDTVEVGDELLKTDMTLVGIDLELENLTLEGLNLRLKLAQSELEKLKKEVPISTAQNRIIMKDMVLTAAKVKDERIDEPETPSSETPSPETPEPETPSSETPEPETPEPETPDPDPEPEIENPLALEELNFTSKPYKGDGTAENPYTFLVKEGSLIKGEFFNGMKGLDLTGKVQQKEPAYFYIEIREGNTVTGNLISAWWKRAISLPSFDPEVLWHIENETILTYDGVEDDQTLEKLDDDMVIDIGDDGGFVIPEGYTKEELDQLKREKTAQIRDLELSVKESNLKIDKIEKKLGGQVVKSTIKGVVEKVGDKEIGADPDGSPFLIVTNEEGFYVTGAISELQLDNITVGQVLEGTAFESGSMFQAEIREISEYPTDSNFYGGYNPNASYYPFIAYIQGGGDHLKNYESANLMVNGGSDPVVTNGLYIMKAFVRSEGNKSYAFVADKDNRLKKQYVTTGKTLWGSYIEIKEGITEEDRLAFPYGKNVKEKTRVRDSSIDELYGGI